MRTLMSEELSRVSGGQTAPEVIKVFASKDTGSGPAFSLEIFYLLDLQTSQASSVWLPPMMEIEDLNGDDVDRSIDQLRDNQNLIEYVDADGETMFYNLNTGTMWINTDTDSNLELAGPIG